LASFSSESGGMRSDISMHRLLGIRRLSFRWLMMLIGEVSWWSKTRLSMLQNSRIRCAIPQREKREMAFLSRIRSTRWIWPRA